MKPHFGLVIAVGFAAACATQSDPAKDAEDPYTASATDEQPPDMVAMAEGVQQGIDLLPQLDFDTCYEAYIQASADRDVECPRFQAEGYWNGSCSTAAGSSYNGSLTIGWQFAPYVTANLMVPYLHAYGPTYVNDYDAVLGPFEGRTLGGSGDGTAVIKDPAGNDFVFGGTFYSITVLDQGLLLQHHRLEGLCLWNANNDTDWVGAQLEPWLTINQLAPLDNMDARHTEVSGSLAGLDGPYSTIMFDLKMVAEALGGRCDAEPEGTVSMRHTDGRWYDITFDPDVACDGCGVVQRDEEFGSLCVDFSPLHQPMSGATVSPGTL